MDFIKGGSSTSVKVLTERMEQAAENLEFELAARLRDRINAIEMMGARQKVVASRVEEQDVFALAQGETHTAFEVFRFTGNRLSDRESFLTEGCQPDPEARSEFLRQYYAIRDRVPPLVVLDGEVEDEELLVRWLSEKRGKTVRLLVPQRGTRPSWCRCAAKMRRKTSPGRRATRGGTPLPWMNCAGCWGWKRPLPISRAMTSPTWPAGKNVAGMVVFENGRPLKSAYRKFKIKTVEGQDDYGSMREVIRRRFQEYCACQEKGEAEGFGRLPDLILLMAVRGMWRLCSPFWRRWALRCPCSAW